MMLSHDAFFPCHCSNKCGKIVDANWIWMPGICSAHNLTFMIIRHTFAFYLLLLNVCVLGDMGCVWFPLNVAFPV